jgi:hypothetical protein
VGAPSAYAELVQRALSWPGVAEGRILHATGLTAGGRVFAFPRRGELVLKLPAARCTELVDDGAARRFDKGDGRPLREWVAVPDARADRWEELALEARAFVAPPTWS